MLRICCLDLPEGNTIDLGKQVTLRKLRPSKPLQVTSDCLVGNMIRALTVLSLLFSKPPAPSGLNITILQPDVPFVPHPHPLPGAASDSKEIIRQFVELDRSTKWRLVEKVKFEGDTYEPEGIVRIGHDRYFVSAGEYIVPTVKYNETINGTDRTPGEGFAHMIVFDGKGNRIADASISKAKSLEVRLSIRCATRSLQVLPQLTGQV